MALLTGSSAVLEYFPDIVGKIPPARLQTMIEAEMFLQEINEAGHQAMIINAIGGAEERTGPELGETFEFCYAETLIRIIGVFGIKLNDIEYKLKDYLYIVRGLFAISKPHNHEVVELFIHDVADPSECLSNILGELEEPHMTWFMERLEYVDGDLINRIKDELNAIQDGETFDEVSVEILSDFKKHVTDDKKGIIAESTAYIPYLPLSFRSVFVSLQGQLKDLPPEELTEELYQLAILSDTTGIFKENLMKVLTALEKDIHYVNKAESYARGNNYVIE